MILAEAIRRTHNGESISYLFGHVPLWRSTHVFFTYSVYNSGPLDSFAKSIKVDLFWKEITSVMDLFKRASVDFLTEYIVTIGSILTAQLPDICWWMCYYFCIVKVAGNSVYMHSMCIFRYRVPVCCTCDLHYWMEQKNWIGIIFPWIGADSADRSWFSSILSSSDWRN